MSKQWIRCLVAGAMLALSVGSAQAYVVFNTLGTVPSGPYNPSDGQQTAGQISPPQTIPGTDPVEYTQATGTFLAQAFTTNNRMTLVDVILTLGLTTGSSSASIAVSLYNNDATNSGNVPGTPLGSQFTFTGTTTISSENFVNYTFDASSRPLLDANATYWVVLSTTGSGTVDWSTNDPANLNNVVTPTSFIWFDPTFAANSYVNYTNPASPTFPQTVDGYPAWSMSAADFPFQMQVDAVPEPSTYVLLMISLGVVGYARKRMTTKE